MNIEETRIDIDFILSNIWKLINMNKPENHERIVEYILNDIYLTADPINWNNADVVIGLRRWMEEASVNN